jgi:hypothetical protein
MPKLLLEGERVLILRDPIRDGMLDDTAGRITTGNADGSQTVVVQPGSGIARYVVFADDCELLPKEVAA